MEREPLIVQEQPPLPSSLLTYLYVAYFLARWGARLIFFLFHFILR